MKLIICLDDNNAMAFYNRRQSSDLTVAEKILELTNGSRLWMNPYSAYLFADSRENILIDENFLSKASNEDFCFAEITDVCPFIPMVHELFVFRWNRIYPADLYFPNIPAKARIIAEFTGNSHEKITLERYCL